MSITAAQVKGLRSELAKLKPVKVTLDGDYNLTVKEAIFALAPTLERMKKRGFDTQEIADTLREKGINVKPPTLAKYLTEFRRGKDKKKDAPLVPDDITVSGQPETRRSPIGGHGFAIAPGTEDV